MKHIGKVFSSITIVALLTTPIASSKHIQAQQQDNQNTATSDKPVTRVILPNNNRHQIFNTTQGHYQSVAFANIGNSAIASGVVIGPNTLLTNKHVVDGTNGNPRNLSFAPAASNQNNYPKGVFTATNYTVSPYGDDLAVVHVGKDKNGQSIGSVVQPASIGASNQVKQGNNITVTGYPGDKPLATMWESFGKVINKNGNEVSYDLSTYGGNSGSPVFNSANQLIGIHYGGVANSHNSAVLLTPQLQQFINSNMR